MSSLLSSTSSCKVSSDTHLNHKSPFPTPHFTTSVSFKPRTRTFKPYASSSSSAASSTSPHSKPTEESISIDVLKRFIKLNVGKWTGSFYQFDANGKLLNTIRTKLSASSYGEDELISLIQTLYIRQPSPNTFMPDAAEESEWAEYKIKETNMFTVDKYQQIGFFPNERAFALRYQTAGMLDNILRQGVLGEDDTGEESPKNLKLPSRRPSIVCENCLYLPDQDIRARAFHIMDPKGVIEMFLIFLEERGDNVLVAPSLDASKDDNRIKNFLGKWKGHSMTKRSGVYGATIAEADTISSLEYDDNGQLIQDISSTSDGGNVTTNVHWTGTLSNNLITFDKGYQITLLPGGMYMGCPCNIANSVADSKSFHLEFSWLESPFKRQRLVRTFDIEGLAVSSTYFSETKL